MEYRSTMPDGSYPITQCTGKDSVESAAKPAHHSKTYSFEQVKAHILAAKKALGCSDEVLPETGETGEDADADDKKRSVPKGTLERRVFNFTEVRTSQSAAGPRRMIGHAAVFNTLSEEMMTPFGQSFREVIRPGTFTKTLREATVFALFNHNPDMPLARSDNGSLFLHADKRGPAGEITPTDPTYARDLLVNMDAGLINRMSFSFETVKDEWRGKVRELQEVSLRAPGDVSPVTFPAYTDTDIQARSIL